MEDFFDFFFFVAFEALIAKDSEIFYSFNALLPSELLSKKSRFISSEGERIGTVASYSDSNKDKDITSSFANFQLLEQEKSSFWYAC